jgi:hypothetical protein
MIALTVSLYQTASELPSMTQHRNTVAVLPSVATTLTRSLVGLVYIVWYEKALYPYLGGHIMLAMSYDSGTTWAYKTSISPEAGSDVTPRIAVSDNGSNVFVVWKSSQGDVLLAKSLDWGRTFKIITISNDTYFNARPSLALSGKNVYIIWSPPTRFSF